MGGGLSTILLEGDQRSRVNDVLKIYNFNNIMDVRDSGFAGHRNLLCSQFGRNPETNQEKYYFIIGVHKGWTVIEYIAPSMCFRDCCARASSLIDGKVVDMGFETHIGYLCLILADKGQVTTHLEQNSWHILKNEGSPLPLNIINKHFDPVDFPQIIRQIIGFNVYDVLEWNGKEQVEKVWVKVAWREIIPDW